MALTVKREHGGKVAATAAAAAAKDDDDNDVSVRDQYGEGAGDVREEEGVVER